MGDRGGSSMRKIARLALAFGMVFGLMFGSTLTASADHVDPVKMTGNVKDCPNGSELLELDPVKGGTFKVDGGTITVTVKGSSFSWSSSGVHITSLLVKGGPDTAWYHYEGGSTGDSGVTALINPKNGKPYGLSHINFCGGGKDQPPGDKK